MRTPAARAVFARKQVWLYAVHRLYVDHIQNPFLPDGTVLDISVHR